MAKKIVGTKEVISILDLELYDLDVKIDTGADSSALHCDDIQVDDDMVHFRLIDDVHPAYHDKKVTMPLYKLKKVRSSNGQLQLRPSIEVDVLFFGQEYKTVVSLTNRKKMRYPMLIGRKFLANRFLVDVSKEYLSKEEQK